MGRNRNPAAAGQQSERWHGPGDEPLTPEQAARQIRLARDHIAAVEAEDGVFTVACRETGVSPVPVSDRTFRTYDQAELACLAARRYRSALGKLDSKLTDYELAVTTVEEDGVEITSVRERTRARRDNGLPAARKTVTLAGNGTDEWLEMENGAVVHFSGPEELLDDEVIARQLDSKL